MTRTLALIALLIATPVLADDLYSEFRSASDARRYTWAQAIVKTAFPDESIGRQERISVYAVGCAKEYSPAVGGDFLQFMLLCVAMGGAEVE